MKKKFEVGKEYKCIADSTTFICELIEEENDCIYYSGRSLFCMSAIYAEWYPFSLSLQLRFLNGGEIQEV